jgi:hypothetical protein
MNKPEKKIGILNRLREREYNGSTYFTAWVKAPKLKDTFFHPSSLINQDDISNIKEGAFILFELKFGERNDAINCNLNCERIILRNIIQYDLDTIKFIFRYGTEELRIKLLSKIKSVQSKSLINDVLEKIENIKKILPDFFQVPEIPSVKLVQETQQNLLVIEKPPSKSFLEIIFETNTTEYNQNLFEVLVKGLKTINNEDVFQQAKLLLTFNHSIKDNKIENLNSIFYHKATDDYKFRLWFERLTNYCSTEILKNNFDKAELNVKTEIIERCKGDKNGFLVLNNEIENTNELEEVYFSGIRTKLLKELKKASQTIFVAVAWFTNDELFNVLCMKLKQGVKVELIIINDYINNWEFGLPFQTFIDFGGKLYLSEHPNIMHHKFCLIDDEIIFNGSYNWTYYAEKRNDENIMFFKYKQNLIERFNTEFNRLKSELGNPIMTFSPFDNSNVTKFERAIFRQYFSTDLTLRAKKIQKTNIIHANELINSAIEIDVENIEAKNFQKEIKSEVSLQERTIHVQNIVVENTASNSLLPNDTKEKNSYKNKLIQNSDKNTVEDEVLHEKKRISTTKKEIAQSFAKPVHKPENQIIERNLKVISLNQEKKSIDTENYSIPKQEPVKKIFQNSKVAIALDISSSMENLYQIGTVQQVVEKLLAVALSISYDNQLDIWTFNQNAKRLNSVSKSNYHNYINNNKISSSGGTNVSTALVDIDKKYFQENKGHDVFVIIITDGDIGELQNFIDNSKIKPIFWQFVGLGSSFEKLNTLNNANNNVAFFSLNNIKSISDDELYKKLLVEFPIWYQQIRTKK